MKRGATVSAVLHLLVLLAFILVIPSPLPPPPPPEDTMEVELEGTAASAQKSQDHGKVAAAAEAEKPADENPALVAPKPVPLEHAPPPPPPPPPAQAAPSAVETLRPEKIPLPPPDREAEAIKPPPPMKLAAPPPPKVAPTQTPVKKPSVDPTQAKPLDTVRHQQQQTKNPAVDTHSLQNTLEKFLADHEQTAPPAHTYNPSRNGARNAGGQVHGNLKGDLTQGQAKTIGDSVKRCFSSVVESKDYATFSVMLEVVVDGSGEVREAHLAPESQAHAARDPAYLAFTDSAIHAVMDPQCSKLPLPPSNMGKPGQTFQFRFRPV